MGSALEVWRIAVVSIPHLHRLSVNRKFLVAWIILAIGTLMTFGWSMVKGRVERKRDLARAIRQNHLPDAAYRAIESDSSLILMSLDPRYIEPPDRNAGFHGYRVLGETAVTNAELRRQLSKSLHAGMDSTHFGVSACFNPRHGLRTAIDGQRYDLLICFECGQLYSFGPSEGESKYHGLGNQADDQPFVDILKSANVPIAEDHSEAHFTTPSK